MVLEKITPERSATSDGIWEVNDMSIPMYLTQMVIMVIIYVVLMGAMLYKFYLMEKDRDNQEKSE